VSEVGPIEETKGEGKKERKIANNKKVHHICRGIRHKDIC
jgi:hypothetical protein